MKKVFILFLLFFAIYCNSSLNYSKTINYNEDTAVNLFAFIGKKLSVKTCDRPLTKKTVNSKGDTVITDIGYFDACYIAEYEVKDLVFNNLKKDTVVFEAYNHMGNPFFDKSDYCLLYLSKYTDKNEYYLQKYMYDHVKRNKDSLWVGVNGKSVNSLFNKKKNGYLKARGIFK